MYYEVQGRHYMALMDLNRGYFCCLYGNNEDEVIIRHIDRDADYESELIFLEQDFRVNNVQAMELEGTWAKGKYGCQLQVERWHEIIPPTIEGIRGYLSSGLLKGIGPKTADAIVQRFGIQSLYVLEHQPEKLLEIRGITEDRLEEIKSGYAESKVMRDLMTLLAPFKVTPARRSRCFWRCRSRSSLPR